MLFFSYRYRMYTTKQIVKKSLRFNECLSFPKEETEKHQTKSPITWTHYTVLPPWASATPRLRTNTIFDIIYYYPHGLQVLSPSALHTTTLMGFRYYHHQPYKLLPPWASGITTFNPFQLLFSQTFYIAAVYCLFNCGIVYFNLFINSFFKNKLWPYNLWLSFMAWNGISCFSFAVCLNWYR